MFRNFRLFVSLMLAFVMIAQPLATMAQDKKVKFGGGGSSIQNETSVTINSVRLINSQDLVEVTWGVQLPTGVQATGFDVLVEAQLSNGSTKTDNKSFGGDARSGNFKFNLLVVSNDGLKPGSGNSGDIGPVTFNGKSDKGKLSSNSKSADNKSDDKTPRKFGQGNISGGGKNNNEEPIGPGVGSNKGNNGIRPVKPTPTPKPVIPPVAPKPTPKPSPKPEQVRITTLRARINAKFAAGNDLAAFSDFIQPTDAVTGEMRLKGARGNALQAKKLIHLNSVARLATECASGQECFDIIAELRGAEATGQFKVSMEVIFANGVRRNTARTVGNLFRPVRLSVDKIAGQQIANVLVNINGGGNREQFTKTDTGGVNIQSPVSPTKK
ncbi:MAG: hypothetical protein SF097_23405 [Acidobacteriota bacterium]|nr:hypothetical protein [Acidobacteriota bacterium]